MKRLLLTIFILGSALVPGSVKAQMMGSFSNAKVNWDTVVEHTVREEQKGKELWGKFQSKEVVCSDLNDEEYEMLGEYFMGQMAGESHAAMNVMMTQAHGEDGEEQIHIVMGKRLTGCDTSAGFPATSSGWIPMMNMMWGGWPSSFGSSFGWIFMILWWILLIAGIVALIRWIMNQSRSSHNESKK